MSNVSPGAFRVAHAPYLQRLVWDSNPPLRLERAESSANRRTSRNGARNACAARRQNLSAVDREALESSSPGFQPGAWTISATDPFQGEHKKPTKKARRQVTPGLESSVGLGPSVTSAVRAQTDTPIDWRCRIRSVCTS